MTRGHPSARQERLLFLAALALTLAVAAVMGADRRIPRGGESRGAFDLLAREDPGGDPYASSGLIPAPALPPLPRFHVGLALEGIVLLAGSWLLARRLFGARLSIFAVSVASAGSAIWAGDLWLNARSVFAVPLLIHLVEEFLETGSRRPLFLAASLAAAQALGLPPGMIPVPFLAVTSWFAARAILFGYPLGDRLRRLRWSSRDLLPAGGILLLGFAVATLQRVPAESSPGSSPMDVLTYAGLGAPGRLLEFLIGATPGTDSTSFCGHLTIGFAALGLVLLPRAGAWRLLAALLASLLALGLVLSALYGLAPGLRPSRPLPFGGPWIRLFVTFLAGFGLDRLVGRAPGARVPLVRVALGLLVASACLGWLSSALILQDRWPEDALLALGGVPPERQSPWFSEPGLLSDALGASAFFAALAGGTLLLAGRARTLPFAFALVLFIHPLDVFAWNSRMTWLMTTAAAAKPAPAVASAWRRSLPEAPRPLTRAASALAALNALVVLAFTGRLVLGSLGLLPDPLRGRPT